MKKTFSFFLTLVLLLASSNAFAKNAYQNYWKPGVYSVIVTEEDKQKYDQIFEKALQLSEGTITRKNYDADSLEGQLEYYLDMIKDDPLPEMYFDDIGTYIFSCGLPDELSISQTDALYISYYVIQNSYQLTDEDLIHFLPFYGYLTADPDNPAWTISFDCYDNSSELSVGISLYAHDESIRSLSQSIGSNG